MRTTLVDMDSPVNLRFSLVAKAAVMAPTLAPTGSANPLNVTGIRHMDSARLVKFNPTLAAVVAAMITCFFVIGFATGHFKRCGNRTAAANNNDVIIPQQSHGRPTTRAAKQSQGLHPEIVDALPLIQFKDLLTDKKVNSCQDCSVCLAPFDPDDHLRLLPECSHMFHSNCVDVWFLSNSTCPLCRACLAYPVEKEGGQDRGRSFSEASEPIGSQVVEDNDVIEVIISRN